MSKLNENIVWGTTCDCGTENYILQNKFHPWIEETFVMSIPCHKCRTMLTINQKKASNYYNTKIYTKFDNISGNVLDLGCGSGFLTSYIANKENVNNIYAVDNDITCKLSIDNLFKFNSKVQFHHLSVSEIKNSFINKGVDYLISRDVFMFIKDTDTFFDDITSIVRKGLRQIAWYVEHNERMLNNLTPEQIKHELNTRGFDVSIEYLNWYKYGYYVCAEKRIIE